MNLGRVHMHVALFQTPQPEISIGHRMRNIFYIIGVVVVALAIIQFVV